MSDQTKNTETIHDAEISPLMKQIIAICKAHKIGFIAALSMVDADGGTVVSRTVLAGPGYPEDSGMATAEKAVQAMARASSPLMLTTRDKDGNITRMEAIL